MRGRSIWACGSPPGTRTRSGCAKLRCAGSWPRSGPTCCACRRSRSRTTGFPAELCRELGFEHLHVHGQKAYHGVAVLSKRAAGAVPHPLVVRHRAQPARDLHPAGRDRAAQFLHPGRRRRARPGRQPEVQAQARHAGGADRATSRAAQGRRRAHGAGRRPQHRAARERRLEPQAAAGRRLAHAGRDRGAAGTAGGLRLRRRGAGGRPAQREALHVVVLPGAGLGGFGPRPTAGPYLAVAGAGAAAGHRRGRRARRAAGSSPATMCR